MWNNVYGDGISSPMLVNSVLWGNTATISGSQIYNHGTGASPVINYSLTQDCGNSGIGWDSACGTDGGDNIDANPIFVDADGADDIPGTLDDDLRLLPGSPAINAGDNNALPAGITTDLAGQPRIVNSTIDRGAYELPPIYLPIITKNH